MAKSKLTEYNVKAAPIREAINRRSLIDFYQLERSKYGGSKRDTGKNIAYVCPVCRSGTGSNQSGALFITNDNHVTCFSSSHPAGTNLSGKGTDTLGALREILGDVSEREVFEYCGYDFDTGERRKDAKPLPPITEAARGEDELPQPLKDYRSDVAKYHAALPGSEAESYLSARGFTAATLASDHWKLGYIEDPQFGRCVVIPYPDTENGYYIKRKISEKSYIKLKRDEAGAEPLFNPNALYSGSEAVFIVESQLCAISIEQSGGKAVAIGGQGAEKLIKLIKEKPTTSTLIVCLDNDPHELIKAPNGTEIYKDERTAASARNLTENLIKAGAKAMTDNSICGASKDPNDAMQANPAAFAEAIRQSTAAAEASEPTPIHAEPEATPAAETLDTTPEATDELTLYMAANASAHLEVLDETIAESSRKKKIKTGFPGLDKKIGGGLFPGLYIMGACTSLGKTAWAMQIIDQIAESGTDCLVFALEMSQDELITRSESRLTFQYVQSDEGKKRGYTEQDAKTQIGIIDGELYSEYSVKELQLIDHAKHEYRRRFGEHIWITEGMKTIGTDEVAAAIKKHIRITHRKPVVLVDYLQTLAEPVTTSGRNLNEKQCVEANILALKRISRDNDIPLIVISAFNRANYTEPVNSAAFKESGMIEYTADVLIGLQYHGMEYKATPKGTEKDEDGNDVTKYDVESQADHNTRVTQLLKRVDERSEAGKPIRIDVKIMKNRKGARGMSNTMQFYSRYLTFVEDSDEKQKKKGRDERDEIARMLKR